MLASASIGLFEEVNKVGRAQFAKGDEGFGASVNGFLEDLLREPAQHSISKNNGEADQWGLSYSGTAGATISVIEPLPRLECEWRCLGFHTIDSTVSTTGTCLVQWTAWLATKVGMPKDGT